MAGAAIGAAGGIIGGMMGADAAGDAADAQRAAAEGATAEQRRQYDQTREDMEPWRNTGQAALNRLAHLMGVGGTGSSFGVPATETQLRAELLPSFTSLQQTWERDLNPEWHPDYWQWVRSNYTNPTPALAAVLNGTGMQNVVDESGLQAAIQARLTAQQQAADAAKNDPQYGSLLRRFTMADYEEDPGYQFRMQQGEQAINRAAAAAGRFDSGRAMKDLTEFNSGLASQEYGNAYNRWNNDQSNIFNRLSGVAGTGQQATNQLAQIGQNTANNIAGNTMAAGNAAAAGQMGAANAWSGALGGATNALSQYFTNRSPYNVSPGFSLGGSLGGAISNPSFSASW